MALGHLKLLQKALDPETKALKRSPHADQMSLGGYRAIRKQLFLTGVPVWNGIDDPYAMRIEDARGREAEFTLDRNGFALVKAPTAVDDFYSTEEIKRIYYPEVELREKLDAIRVFVFNHNVGNAGRPGASTPVRRVLWAWSRRTSRFRFPATFSRSGRKAG